MGIYDYNKSDAFKSIHGFRDDYDWSFNVTDYNNIENLTAMQMGADNTSVAEASINAFFTPITGYWVNLSGFGAWFYVLVMFFTCGTVFIKSKGDLHVTSVAMLVMSIVVAGPATLGTFVIPAEIIGLLYTLIALSLGFILYNLFAGGKR